jgi:CheY-like chemotaxis protein
MEARVKILCVDDEPNVLEGLQLYLRRKFDVTTATSGKQGLEVLYDRSVVDALITLNGGDGERVVEVPLHVLRTGMVLAEDVRMTNGMLPAGRGYEVTASFVERLRNLKPGSVKEAVRVVQRKA